MATAPMTEKQRVAIEALEGARREGKSLSDYAKAHGLSIWALYNALACLRRKGVLPKAARKARSKFVAVRVAPEQPAPMPQRAVVGGMICRIVHRDGYVIECGQWPPASWLAALGRESSDAAT
jgi:hypothetical protein